MGKTATLLDERAHVAVRYIVSPVQRMYLQAAAKAVGSTLKGWLDVTLLREAENVLGITMNQFSKREVPKRRPGKVSVTTNAAIKNLGLEVEAEEVTNKGETNERKSIWE